MQYFKKMSLCKLSQSTEKVTLVTFEFWSLLNLNCLKKEDEI